MMQNILTLLLFILLFAVLVSLGFGIFTLFRGDEFRKKYGNGAMRWRVLLQGAALLVFFLILWFGR